MASLIGNQRSPWLCFAVVLTSVALSTSAAAAAPSGAALPSDLMAERLSSMMIGLLVVLGVIIACGALMRRVLRFQTPAGHQLRIVSGISMGTRERLVVVQVGDTQLLLGVAPGRIQTLHVLDKPLGRAEGPGAEIKPFSHHLTELLGRLKPHG